MRFSRSLAVLAAVFVCAGTDAAVALPADVSGAGTALTPRRDGRPALTRVVGRSVSYVVYNDRSNSVIYLGNPSVRSRARVFARHAHAIAVSGNLVEYVRDGRRLWRSLDGSGRHGVVPSSWRYLAPDGGLRITQTFGRRVLRYEHLDGTTQSYPLPAGTPIRRVHYSVVAGLGGIVLTSSAPGAVPRADLLGRSGTFRSVRTTGLHRSAPLTCESISGSVIGCVSRNSVVRLDATRGAHPQITRLSRAPQRVAVTGGYTSWTTALGRHGHCPCAVASIDKPGDAQSIMSGLTSRSLVSGSGRFYYSKGRTLSTAGVYVSLFAGSSERKVAKADKRRAD